MNLRIAFVACNKNAARYADDASFTYRCENLATALQTDGHEIWLGHVSNFPWTANYDVVVFHRPRATLPIRILIAWLQYKGALTVADFDDLVFASEFACHSPAVINGQLPLQKIERIYLSHFDALRRFPVVTVSTQPLADVIQDILPSSSVLVVPNAIHWSWLSKPLQLMPTSQRTITYLPGTRSHDSDFALIAPALSRVLQLHRDVNLRIIGPLSFKLDNCENQITHQPKLPFSRFHEAFSGTYINLAPLVTTPFTRCKSAIKIIEAAFWDIPTVCSPLPDAARFTDRGAIFAADPFEFENRLTHLLDDQTDYRSISNGLRERMLPIANIHSIAGNWLDFIHHKLSSSTTT